MRNQNRNKAISRGAYSIHRGIWDHPFFKQEEYTEREAWIWMVGAAVYAPCTIHDRGRSIDLNRGEFSYSLRDLAAQFGWSKTRVNGYLNRLEREKMLISRKDRERTEKKTTNRDSKKDREKSIYTVVNYDDYQPLINKTEISEDSKKDREKSINEDSPKDKKKAIEIIRIINPPPIIPPLTPDLAGGQDETPESQVNPTQPDEAPEARVEQLPTRIDLEFREWVKSFFPEWAKVVNPRAERAYCEIRMEVGKKLLWDTARTYHLDYESQNRKHHNPLTWLNDGFYKTIEPTEEDADQGSGQITRLATNFQ